jgi:hypothetical protein
MAPRPMCWDPAGVFGDASSRQPTPTTAVHVLENRRAIKREPRVVGQHSPAVSSAADQDESLQKMARQATRRTLVVLIVLAVGVGVGAERTWESTHHKECIIIAPLLDRIPLTIAVTAQAQRAPR